MKEPTWKIEYDNDVGPNDEGFSESWTVSNGERTFWCDSKEDAEFLKLALKIAGDCFA